MYCFEVVKSKPDLEPWLLMLQIIKILYCIDIILLSANKKEKHHSSKKNQVDMQSTKDLHGRRLRRGKNRRLPLMLEEQFSKEIMSNHR